MASSVMALLSVYLLAVGHAVWLIRRRPATPQARFILFLLSLMTAGLALEFLPRDKR